MISETQVQLDSPHTPIMESISDVDNIITAQDAEVGKLIDAMVGNKEPLNS